MNGLWNGILKNYITSLALVLFGVTCLAFNTPAFAQDGMCSTKALPGWEKGKNPPADVQRLILDTLYGYAWTIDERDPAAFGELFIPEDTSYYELCDVTGPILKVLFKDKGIETEMAIIAKDLKDNKLQTRHLVTNTLFEEIDANTVKTKSIVLVTVQVGSFERPELDYTADARATLKKDTDGAWRFEALTVHADYAALGIRKR